MAKRLQRSWWKHSVRKFRSLSSLVRNAGGVLYLDVRRATGNAFPTNTPSLTTPWVDVSGKGNNATPTGFAGTTASGVDVSDQTKPFWQLDGNGDIFTLVDTTTIDITTAPLAVFSTFQLDAPAQNGFLFAKNASLATDIQYALLYDNATTKLTAWLEGAAKGSSITLTTGVWYNGGFIWDGTTVKYYISQVTGGTNGSYNSTLTTRANVRVGSRSTGASNTGYVKGRLATVTVYSGSRCTETNILKAEKQLSKAYLS